jgi:hypothetical protein
VDLSLPALSCMAWITREAMTMPPLRRAQKPQLMATIMKRSDFEEPAPLELEEVFPMT